jgi:hypothetical protein
MVGAPQETIEMMQESLAMADALHADEVFFGLLYPLPRTDILKLCEEEQVLDQDYASSSYEVKPITKTKYASKTQIQKFLRKVRNWQMKQYIKYGIKIRGPMFLVDCLRFLFFYKKRYRFEMDQLFRWNIQRYKLHQVWKQ